MADTVFVSVFPALKAIDNGDGTYSVAARIAGMPPLTGLTPGQILVADSATSAEWTQTLDQLLVDTTILDFASTGDVAHGATDLAPTAVYGRHLKTEATSGGLTVMGLKDADGVAGGAHVTEGYLAENVDTTKSTAGRALVEVFGAQTSGVAIANVVANGNVWAVRSQVGAAAVTQAIISAPVSGASPGGLWLNGGLVTGGVSPVGYAEHLLGGDFTSDGTSSVAEKLRLTGTLTGAGGDTTWLTGTFLNTVITTQTAAEVIGVVSQLKLEEPTITKNVTTITVAATLYITDAPSEGATNAAIYVVSGDTVLRTLSMNGALSMNGNNVQNFGFLSQNGTEAANGALRLVSQNRVAWRNNGNTDDIYLNNDAGDNLVVTNATSVDLGASCEADAYTVGGAAGVDYGPADISSITIVKGIVTAVAA